MITCPACSEENIDGAETCEHCGDDLTHLSRPRAKSRVERSLQKEPVSFLRPHPAVVVRTDRKVREVIASLILHNDGCAVVIDHAGKTVGVFSERDLLFRLALEDDAQLDRPVSEFMTPDPVTIAADAPIIFALHQMDLGGYRHLPLLDKGKPVGMVSVRDIITYVGDRFLDEELE